MAWFGHGLVIASDAVATMMEVNGNVEVTLSRTLRTTQGRNGLLLYAKDRIRTGLDGKATILFRDGSRLRLFENTEFVIEAVTEQKSNTGRSFQYKLLLKLGAIWSHFAENHQDTKIQTKDATISIQKLRCGFLLTQQVPVFL